MTPARLMLAPIVLMIGAETMGDHRREARDTHPAPIGPNCAHDRRPWETTGPEARDAHPAPSGANCAHDRRPWETAGPSA